jgi:dTDP-4-amino-4,6-dideoxygalactose transaminase
MAQTSSHLFVSLKMTIYVTRPFLPPLEDFLPDLEKIWGNRILSNCGPYHVQFEDALCDALKINHISLFSNGTFALLVAIRALGLKDAEIITTPYSFVATSSTIVWSGNIPVFVDIDPTSTNIDPANVEKAITSKTKAILAVHCYGHPCQTEQIAAIAQKHNLKVIYDAAHAFGIETGAGSVLNDGDLSIISFHATKAFNTFEGGAIICNSPEMKTKIDRLKNFGFVSETQVEDIGINAKMSEFNAALGLLQLKHFDKTTEMRGRVDQHYRALLGNIHGIECIQNTGATRKNYNYFPILVKQPYALTRDELYDAFKANDIHARRYFYPLITNFSNYNHFASSNPAHLPVATTIAQQILCLPIYPELPLTTVEDICKIIQRYAPPKKASI